MYENYYNPYLQQSQQRYAGYQQPIQQMSMFQNQATIQGNQLIGRTVNSANEIQANDVPMNMPYALFPKNDLSEIYLKSWSPNGTIQTRVFKPESQHAGNLPQEQAELKLDLSDESMGGILKRFDDLSVKLNAIEQMMADNNTKKTEPTRKNGDAK